MEKPFLACHRIRMWLGQILLLTLLFVSSPAGAKSHGRSHLKHLWQKNILLISSKSDAKIISKDVIFGKDVVLSLLLLFLLLLPRQ